MGKFHSKKKNQANRRNKSGKKKRNDIARTLNQAISKDPGCPKFKTDTKVGKKRRRRSKKSESQAVNQTCRSLLSDAVKRDDQFLNNDGAEPQSEGKSNQNQNFKKSYREFKKVIEAADVIIEVLDARDPLGSRCKEVEQAVINAGPDKRLILLLNKIDLIPRENLEKWLKYLRNEFPTVAFKACTQTQDDHLSHSSVAAIHMSEKLQTTSRCIGAKFLMKVLGNYCRNKGILMSIKVGVVGFPNVGKSSVINSLKRCHACNVGSTPGITKTMQEIGLDKHVRLLDCPGVVFAKEGSEKTLALRNAIRIESLEDVQAPAEAIIQRVPHTQLCEQYNVPEFSSVQEFLFLLGKKLGRFRKGGVPDADAAALKLLNDWNSGVIQYFTHPPEEYEPLLQISTEIVQEMSKAFDLSALTEEMELEEETKGDEMDNVQSEMAPDAAMEAPHDEEAVQLDKQDTISHNNKASSSSPSVSTRPNRRRKKRSKIPPKDSDRISVLQFQKSKQQKMLFKKQKKQKRRNERLSAALSKTLDSALSL